MNDAMNDQSRPERPEAGPSTEDGLAAEGGLAAEDGLRAESGAQGTDSHAADSTGADSQGADSRDTASTNADSQGAAKKSTAKQDVHPPELHGKPRQGYLDPSGSEATREMRDTARRRRDAEEKLQQHLIQAKDHIPNEHHGQQ